MFERKGSLDPISPTVQISEAVVGDTRSKMNNYFRRGSAGENTSSANFLWMMVDEQLRHMAHSSVYTILSRYLPSELSSKISSLLPFSSKASLKGKSLHPSRRTLTAFSLAVAAAGVAHLSLSPHARAWGKRWSLFLFEMALYVSVVLALRNLIIFSVAGRSPEKESEDHSYIKSQLSQSSKVWWYIRLHRKSISSVGILIAWIWFLARKRKAAAEAALLSQYIGL